MTRWIAAVLLVLGAMLVHACEIILPGPGDLVENPATYSANHRYCVVLREYERLPDFTEDTYANATDRDSPHTTITAALYEMNAESHRLISEMKLDAGNFRELLVSDSGSYLIAVKPVVGGFCGRRESEPDDPIVTIYTAGGNRAGGLKAGDVFTDYDIRTLGDHLFSDVDFTLEHDGEGREIVVISVNSGAAMTTRRIDVATARLLDEKREISPSPRVYATAAAGSETLFSRAFAGPLPAFPPMMINARIRGTVGIHVVVSENGDVVETKLSKSIPFGADAAALEAVKHWKFRRSRTMTSGDILFHFADLSEEKWRELMRDAPPEE